MIGLLLLSLFTFVELNCENLFDTRHDSLKHDEEFLPTSALRWTPYRYWRKIDHISKDILSCGELDSIAVVPDMVVLTEVENDSVMHDLTRRSLLRGAGYDYVMTSGPDLRGIDVALMFSPYAFRLINNHAIRITPPEQLRTDAVIDTYDDHRIAMCFSLVSLMGVPVVINDPKCTHKTFPTYFDTFAGLAAG